MDAGPLLRQVDPDRLRADVEAVAVPRSAGDAGLVSVEEHVFSRLADAGLFVYDDRVADDLGPNLVAGVGGTVCPERTAVVVAHYDALAGSPGADDNATGVAALLEAARIVLEHRLPMSVGFVLVDDGTGDRAGSRLLVERLEEQRLIPVGAISLDGIGVTSSSVDEQLKVDGQFLLMAADEQSEYLARVFAVSVDRFLPDFWAWSAEVPLDRYGEFAESDHQPFWEAGHQALWFTDANFWRSDIAGTEADTPDTIDYDFLANGTRALLAGLVGLGSIDFDDDGVPDVCTREL